LGPSRTVTHVETTVRAGARVRVDLPRDRNRGVITDLISGTGAGGGSR
jgi:hypothetical protein